MPRGYLKNCTGSGKKRGRGGSSRRTVESDRARGSLALAQRKVDLEDNAFVSEDSKRRLQKARRSRGRRGQPIADPERNDIVLSGPEQLPRRTMQKPNIQKVLPGDAGTTTTGTCAICLEEDVALVRLFKNCQHALACSACLRQVYVRHAQKDVAQYPLRCFHPSCSKILQQTQLERLALDSAELSKHYRWTVLAKSYQNPQSKVLHCPSCDHPRQTAQQALPTHDQLQTFSCRSCGSTFGLHHFLAGKEIRSRVLDAKATQNERSLQAYRRRRAIGSTMDMQKFLRRANAMFFREMAKERINSSRATTVRQTRRVLETLPSDGVGQNSGWTLCPRCRIVISKGDGCDHMRCVCGWDFSWREAREYWREAQGL
ncbi:expressed unknown protein [Seminavis robusta]|uniref:RING-type domain-containing protein n=1 Tax=Seminavis robusta TaxID=568900 RepID=A0A9N8ETY3_9STRA|nr:expressed unknown protein [Seminavis robusta]|eukprot:Sro1683_g290890.1 n/a (373) ;mRNA; f:511-1629